MAAQSPILATVTYKTIMGQNKKRANTVARKNPSSLHPTQKQIVKVQENKKLSTKKFQKKSTFFRKKLKFQNFQKIKQKGII